jgi:hypothetical protein
MFETLFVTRLADSALLDCPYLRGGAASVPVRGKCDHFASRNRRDASFRRKRVEPNGVLGKGYPGSTGGTYLGTPAWPVVVALAEGTCHATDKIQCITGY